MDILYGWFNVNVCACVSIFRIIFDCSPSVVVFFWNKICVFFPLETTKRMRKLHQIHMRWWERDTHNETREKMSYLVIISTMDIQLVVDVLFDLFLFSLPFDSCLVRRLDAKQFFGSDISVAHPKAASNIN